LVIKKQQEENYNIHGNSIFAALVAAEGAGIKGTETCTLFQVMTTCAAHPPVMDGYLLRSAGVKQSQNFAVPS
jgi:hypothetical protein